ncbi:nuclear transport factor 2 family protein [Yinghuangia aomiensis]|uniref:Nuclear transport factor 2 family protein n=1 Tax=Yinghuangia aomiensis TaxID=676205 RepID=A0ABP9ICK0_9ACTN
MSDINELVDRYITVWNETDANARRTLVAETFSEQARYTDPMTAVTGRADLDAVIAAVQVQFTGLVFSLAGAVDAHHDIARFTWNLGLPGEEPLVVGFDVVETDGSGRIHQVQGFLDKVPAGA